MLFLVYFNTQLLCHFYSFVSLTFLTSSLINTNSLKYFVNLQYIANIKLRYHNQLTTINKKLYASHLLLLYPTIQQICTIWTSFGIVIYK